MKIVQKMILSAISLSAVLGTSAFAADLSDWAIPGYQSASEAGLVSYSVVQNNLQDSVTREEFCELAMNLYKKLTNEDVPVPAGSPFTDTDSVATGYSRNLGVRCLANAFTDAYTAKEVAGAPNSELMAMGTGTIRRGIVEGDTVDGTVMVGQALNVLNDILPCQEVMERLMAEAKEAIERVKKIEF